MRGSEKERERTGILFLGLLVWHLETAEIPGRRMEGNVLNRREIKKEGRKSLFSFPVSGLVSREK